MSKPTALRTMTELKAIGLVEIYDLKVDRNRQRMIRLKDGFSWLRDEDFKKLRRGFEPVDNLEFMNDTRKTNSPHLGSENQNDGMFHCGHCSFSCSSRYVFKRHLVEAHGQPWDDQKI